jgi:hypothetical protein
LRYLVIEFLDNKTKPQQFQEMAKGKILMTVGECTTAISNKRLESRKAAKSPASLLSIGGTSFVGLNLILSRRQFIFSSQCGHRLFPQLITILRDEFPLFLIRHMSSVSQEAVPNYQNNQ